MDLESLIKTIGLCSISILIEAFSASKDGRQWFEKLKKPKYSFSLGIWYFVGGAYYIIFGVIIYREFYHGSHFLSVSIILATLAMIINGLSNFILFKYRSLKWFYLIIYPFGILLIVLTFILSLHNILSATLASVYLLWLIYDLNYTYNLWKLNSETSQK